LGSYYFGYGRNVGNPVRVGMIGTGDEGCVLIGAHNPDYLNIVAIADIRPYNIHRAFHGDRASPNAYSARPGLLNKYDWKSEDQARKHVTVYDQGDTIKALLADANVEAVIIALPLHMHAQVAIAALRAGKHVLTEKLMGHSVRECKEMARVAEETRLLLATGHQRHYSILYDNAVEMIKAGLLGELHHIRAQWHRGNLPGNDSWQPPLPWEANERLKKIAAELQKLQADLSKADPARIDALLAQQQQLELIALDVSVKAEEYGYQWKDGYETKDGKISPLEELIRWRLFERTGGGLMAELGSHQLDASGIFITAMRNAALAESQSSGRKPEKALPLSVVAVGGRHLFPKDRDCEDHVYCSFEYPGRDYLAEDPKTHHKKCVVSYSSINGNGFGGYGEIVLGTKGTLIVDKEQEVMLFPTSGTKTSVSVSKSKDDLVLSTQASPTDAEAGKKALETGPVSRGYTEEMEHWAWCIRNPSPENIPRCHPEVALADAVIALTTNLAMRQNRRIEFKKEWFDYHSDETPEGGDPPDPGRYS
jgi:predicted dehydrogenase